jgi:hypothetical protein
MASMEVVVGTVPSPSHPIQWEAGTRELKPSGRSVVLVELELDGAVKRDNGEGRAGVCLCEGVVIGV